MLAFMLLVSVQSPLWVYRGAWWPECVGPMHRERQLVQDRVVVVVGLCGLRPGSMALVRTVPRAGGRGRCVRGKF